MKHLREYKELFESSQELPKKPKYSPQEQSDWLDECVRGNGTWSVNPKTGLVDIKGLFQSTHEQLTDFKGVRFGKVSGGFFCDYNQLTSLEGAPQEVGGDFYCHHNRLTSLEGGPRKVGGSYYCNNNFLTSLEGAPEVVPRMFVCTHNKLTSLKGCPKKIGSQFLANNNELTSLEGAPQYVEGPFYLYDNPISTRAAEGVLRRMIRDRITLEQAVADYWKHIPRLDKPHLAKHNPNLSPEQKRGYEALLRFKTRVI